MRSVQEIFNLAISTGAYQHSVKTYGRGMCLALSDMLYTKTISHRERTKAMQSIDRYLKFYMYLAEALYHSGQPTTYEAMLAIYSNWRKRPVLRHTSIE